MSAFTRCAKSAVTYTCDAPESASATPGTALHVNGINIRGGCNIGSGGGSHDMLAARVRPAAQCSIGGGGGNTKGS